ncbi:MAG: nucleotidyltransferase domain-containing protein [Deltaproteobacteria bacterium]|nr:nucleotidyltransferase domain-containing protein [Deltaproteobacteria bacterium]
MLTPDLDLGRRFLVKNPPPGQVLLCAVTGSHLYGFPSPDSDLDLKGIHVFPTEWLLGLERPADTYDRLELFEGSECDYTSHEVGKALLLLLRGNGNLLERMLSPFQLWRGERYEELATLARGTVSRRFSQHYAGFFRGACREHLAHEPRQAKTMLYAYRVALTGLHLLRSGELVADLGILAPEYGFPQISELIQRKRAGEEREPLTPEEEAAYRGRWPELEALLASAVQESRLPPEASNRAHCEDWLIRLRREALGTG